eukprot:UN02661
MPYLPLLLCLFIYNEMLFKDIAWAATFPVSSGSTLLTRSMFSSYFVLHE